MTTRLAVGGSSAYPPTIGHKIFLEALLNCGLFDTVVWIVSGKRNDKDYQIDPLHRQNMTDLLVTDLAYNQTKVNLIVINEKLDQPNTPTIAWLEQYAKDFPSAIVNLYTGSDSIIPHPEWNNLCEIEAKWVRGPEVIKYPIVVIPRRDFALPLIGDPIYDRFVDLIILGKNTPVVSSTLIRENIKAHLPWQHATTPKIATYIENNQLFQNLS